MRDGREAFWGQQELTEGGREGGLQGLEAESEPGGRSLRSLKMHSHGEGHLRGRGGVGMLGNWLASRSETVSATPEEVEAVAEPAAGRSAKRMPAATTSPYPPGPLAIHRGFVLNSRVRMADEQRAVGEAAVLIYRRASSFSVGSRRNVRDAPSLGLLSNRAGAFMLHSVVASRHH